jgi:hypothetical protein
VHQRGESKKKKFAREISKEFFVGGNAKHAHLAENNDLLTQKNMVKSICISSAE